MSSFVRALACLSFLLITTSGCGRDTAERAADAEPGAETATAEACELPASIPHDVVTDGAVGEQASLDKFSWASFGAMNSVSAGGSYGVPLWASWSSTADLLNLVKQWSDDGADPDTYPAFGERYLQPTCQTYCDANPGVCDGLRTLEQVGKINDAIFEADAQGLSANPVIASNQSFVRYEIRINQDMYDLVKDKQLYSAAKVAAAEVNATCGSNQGAEGVINAKLAWMDMANLPDGLQASDYYTEKRIVFTSGTQRSDGNDACEVRDMGLVGMHIAHKTISQQAWIWSTFEHSMNAPDCAAPSSTGVNYGCPASVSTNYNFYSTSCKAMPAFDKVTDGKYYEGTTEVYLESGDPCQFCNVVPAANDPSSTCQAGFCVDEAPATDAGMARLCRQVPMTDPAYEDAAQQNTTCHAALGDTLWANYILISTQWYANAAASSSTCNTIAASSHGIEQDGIAKNVRYNEYASDGLTGGQYAPQVTMTGSTTRPRLGNTSMESYESSNCVGCHSKGALLSTPVNGSYTTPKQGSTSAKQDTAPDPLQSATYSSIKTGDDEWTVWTFTTPNDTYVHTDFSWWLALEVPADGVP